MKIQELVNLEQKVFNALSCYTPNYKQVLRYLEDRDLQRNNTILKKRVSKLQ